MSSPTRYVILDFETTGLDPQQSEIIEIGAILVEDTRALARFHCLVKPTRAVPPAIAKLTGISDEMLSNEKPLAEIAPGFLEFLGDLPIVAHNAALEQGFLDTHFSESSFTVHNSIEPLALILPDHGSHSMESMRNWAGIVTENAHRADQDCEDLLLLLEHGRKWMLEHRPHTMRIVHEILPDWWWSWFFSDGSDPASLDFPEREYLGDLKTLKTESAEKEINWKDSVSQAELQRALRSEGDGFQYRETQAMLAEEVAGALVRGGKIAVEAPTGTGKSLAYLLPGILAARKSGAPLVVSTHSKSLQDQLLEKDIPLARRLLNDPDVKASTVKGQDNYLCQRKLHDLVGSVTPDSPLDERWSIAYLHAFSASQRTAELDRVSHYLRRQFEPLNRLVDQVRSHYTTTIGPVCPFYKTCHFYDSARLAHQSDVIIANHSLVFRWPGHLPEVHNVVFDEAHHLEDQITEAYSVRLSEQELADTLDRLSRKHGNRRAGDTTQIAKLLSRLGLPGEKLADLTDAIRTRLAQLRSVIPLSLHPDRDAGSAYDEIINLSLPPRNASAHHALLESVANLAGTVESLAEYLAAGVKACEDEKIRQDRAADLLKAHAFRVESYGQRLRSLLAPVIQDASPSAAPEKAPAQQTPADPARNFLRLLYWNGRDNVWRLVVAPIEVGALAGPFFQTKRSVIATSATLSTGQVTKDPSEEFISRRAGLELSKPLMTLPSPYELEKQAVVYIPTDLAQPGTPSHLESLIDFTASAATALGGRTLLLMTSNQRLRIAAEALRERLAPHGIEVFDSVSDRRAAEAFRSTERALLIGSERYGEGLDIPGPALSCVIIEKINEAMTRSPLAEARKSLTRFALFDYDFPIRMMWLKQRVGRLIRSHADSGSVVVFDPRYHRWSAASRAVVNRALAPIPVQSGTREQVLMKIDTWGKNTLGAGSS